MGGNALKNTNTVRKKTEEFLIIADEIFKIINRYSIYEQYVVKYYHDKKTHGDIDILIKIFNKKDVEIILNFIKNHFIPNECIKNGNVISFNYNDFQVDFILINFNIWSIAKHYFDYDCLGNILGKTFHKFGLSYGWDGLFYKFRNFNGRNSQNILISTDARKIFEFGGYDYDRYLQGFETLEDIIKFTINTKYFDTQIFQMKNLKSIDKKRNRKRGSYHTFLKYLEENNVDINYSFHKNKELYLPMIDEAFPEADLLGKLYDLKLIDTQNKVLSQKFNGDIVMSWLPNLKGKELGQAMSKFKESLGDEYNDFILNTDYTLVYVKFMEIYNDK